MSQNFSQKMVYESCVVKLARLAMHKISLFTFCCIFLFACEKKNVINEAFREKYGKEIEQMKLNRAAPQVEKNDAKYNFEPLSASVTTDTYNSKNSEPQQYYANVDATQYPKTKPQQFFPDSNVYNEGKAAQTLPDNLFELSYNTTLSPPFRAIKSEFDLIRIPPYDFYGVRTALEEKQYILIGNNYLQKNIDTINANKSQEDVEISKMLIQEQKKLKRQYKMEKIFGLKDQVIDKPKVDLEKESQEKPQEKPPEKIVEEKAVVDNKEIPKNSEQNDVGKVLPEIKKEESKNQKGETVIDKILKIN